METHKHQLAPGKLHTPMSRLPGCICVPSCRSKWSAGILILGLACTMLSCATSSGSTYRSSVEGESSAAARAAEAKQERQDRAAAGANKQNLHTGNQDQLYQGSFYTGYNQPTAITFTVVAPTGSILVEGAPSGAELLVDGLTRSRFQAIGSGPQARATVEAGQHRVRVEYFGYASWEADVQVRSDSLVRLQVNLTPVPFSLHAPGTSNLVFDPSRPGRAGTITAGFSATAPGRATAEVLDASGRILRSLGSQDIRDWSVPVSWDGRDDRGLVLAPGTYTLRLGGSGQGPESGPEAGLDSRVLTSEASILVTITKLPPINASSLHGGFSGAMLAPDALVLPPGSLQLSAGGYAFIDMETGNSKARVPIWTGIRVGGYPFPGAEMAVSAMLTSYPGYDVSPPMDGISAAGSIKSPLLTGDHLATALIVRAAAATFTDEASSGWPPSWDGAARYPGVGAGLVFQWTPGGTQGRTSTSQAGGATDTGRLFATAELNAGRFYPGWDDDDGAGVWEVPGFFAWPYIRAGFETCFNLDDAGHLSVQGSAAARGQPVGIAQGFRPPLSLAGELAWYPPASPFVVHVYGIGEWEGFYSWYFAGGAGISVLY